MSKPWFLDGRHRGADPFGYRSAHDEKGVLKRPPARPFFGEVRGDGAPGRTPAPNSHAAYLDYYLEVGQPDTC